LSRSPRGRVSDSVSISAGAPSCEKAGWGRGRAEMQTKLFEPMETMGAAGDWGGLDHSEGPSGEVASVGRNGAGAVVIRASSRAIYGTQSTEFWIRNGLPAIRFADLVRESSGHRVLPIDPCSSDDMLLLRHLSQAMTAFVRLTEKSGQRFTGNRINEVGKRLEYMIADELRKTPIEASVLGRPGYPDCVLKQGERVSYLEIKASASVKEPNRFLKSFSFSSGKKIKSDARHLLLKVQLEEEDNKIWKAMAWELRDLSTLKTRLKTEFNAGVSDLAVVRLLGSSDKSVHALTMGGQSILDPGLAPRVTPRRRRSGRPGATG
jgi:hypothetical protein